MAACVLTKWQKLLGVNYTSQVKVLLIQVKLFIYETYVYLYNHCSLATISQTINLKFKWEWQKQLFRVIPHLITFFPFGPSLSPVSPRALMSTTDKVEEGEQSITIMLCMQGLPVYHSECAHLRSRSTRWPGLTIFSILTVPPRGPGLSWRAPRTPLALSDNKDGYPLLIPTTPSSTNNTYFRKWEIQRATSQYAACYKW